MERPATVGCQLAAKGLMNVARESSSLEVDGCGAEDALPAVLNSARCGVRLLRTHHLGPDDVQHRIPNKKPGTEEQQETVSTEQPCLM
jgi:hypothetical protein